MAACPSLCCTFSIVVNNWDEKTIRTAIIASIIPEAVRLVISLRFTPAIVAKALHFLLKLPILFLPEW